MIMFAVIHTRMKDKEEEEDSIFSHSQALPPLPPPDTEVQSTEPLDPFESSSNRAELSDAGGSVTNNRAVEIEIPTTPLQIFSDMSASSNSFSESPLTLAVTPSYGHYIDFTSPATPSTPGLGISRCRRSGEELDLALGGFSAEKYFSKKLYRYGSSVGSV